MKCLQINGTNPQQFIGYDDEFGICFATTARSLIAPITVLDCLEQSKALAAADTGVSVDRLELVEV